MPQAPGAPGKSVLTRPNRFCDAAGNPDAMNLLVVGAGEMGRWFATALADSGPDDIDIAFADADAEVARAAAAELNAQVVDVASAEPVDLVAVAVPMSGATSVIDELAPLGDAVVDVTGTMRGPVRAMREAAPSAERMSLHPLFAPANEPGNVAVVTDADGPLVGAVREALSARGNDLFETEAAAHDEAMESVQASAHAAVLAYALAAADVREEFATPVSARLDDLVGTVTGGTPRVYREIQETFAGADRVAEAARRVADADGEAFEALYREAGEK
jgi:prephenate dehydrogenase